MNEFLRSLSWLLPIVELLRLATFAIFVILGLAYRFAAPELRRRRAGMLISYVAFASAAAGLTQIDAWPFSNWALVHTLRGEEMRSWEIEAQDASGRWWTVDPRVLQPLAPEEFGVWMFTHGLPPSVASFVLERAERGRVAFLRKEFPSNDRFLGAASAPFHFRQRRLWMTRSDVPSTPFVAARIVRLRWNIEEHERRGAAAIHRDAMPARVR